ncbi:unnamed protein product [Spirodela intermedia]|uniref:HTH La-type RNA-binding domain-containing protein n=1 Tax=Spirodela intermedia TaxID=51605 RepID=A0A7I8IGL1_SPIIN|nr:unnamed protein product [Spirodela intermedia]CAA6656002.1 unnamed protein product [Spirodela intermedia]
MATAADSSPSYSSSHAPPFPRNARNLSSPWSHVVRGESDETPAPAAAASPSVSDRSPLKTATSDTPADVRAGDAAGAPTTPPPSSNVVDQEASASSQEMNSAWKTFSNGSINAGSAIKVSLKSSSSDSLKGLANGSVSVPSAPVTTSPKPTATNPNTSSSASHAVPARQKAMKRHGGSGGVAGPVPNNNGGGFTSSGIMSPGTQTGSAEASHNASDKVVASGPSPRELPGRTNDWDNGSKAGGNEHQRNHNSNRRGNNAGGGGHHHSNFGNRADQGRGGYEWNNRSFGGGRDMHTQHQQQQQPRAMARPFLRPQPPGPAPFIPPPPQIRPFANPMGYHDISPPVFYVPPPLPEPWRGMPFVPPTPMYFAPPDLQLRAMLLQQIEYYFSPENLCRDVFLRQNMDEEGWVPVSLVAGFRRSLDTELYPL